MIDVVCKECQTGFVTDDRLLVCNPCWALQGARMDNADLRAQVAALTAERDEARAENMAARQYLWLQHGHVGMYGDDGEMQCSMCGPAAGDFKRDTMAQVIEAVVKAARDEQNAAIARVKVLTEALTEIATVPEKALLGAQELQIIARAALEGKVP